MNNDATISHVIITGTTKGLGFCLCQNFLQQGYKVTGFARSEAPSAFQSFILTTQYTHIIADMSDLKSTSLIIYEFIKNNTAILILNAADYSMSSIYEEKKVLGQLNLNELSPILIIENVLSRQLSYHPQLVFISSIMADIYDERNPAYGAAKSAVSYFIDTSRSTHKSVSFLKVVAGPILEAESVSTFRGLFSITYSLASKKIMQAINDRKEVIFIPHIWRYIIYAVGIIGKKKMSKLINNFR